MTHSEISKLAGTLARVFVAATLAQFIAGGADVFALDAGALRTIVSSGIAAAAVALYNYLNPRDARYGRGA